MNLEQRQQIGLVILNTARYYNRIIEKETISMMLDDLSDLSFEEILKAYKKYRLDSKNKTFPLPAQIRDLINPEATDESVGRDISAKILSAISKFGYPNAKDARAYIGEFGWGIVNKLGGWSYLCENRGLNLNSTSFIAQVRDLATDLSKHGQLAIDNKILSIGKDEPVLIGQTPISNLIEIKQVPKDEDEQV